MARTRCSYRGPDTITLAFMCAVTAVAVGFGYYMHRKDKKMREYIQVLDANIRQMTLCMMKILEEKKECPFLKNVGGEKCDIGSLLLNGMRECSDEEEEQGDDQDSIEFEYDSSEDNDTGSCPIIITKPATKCRGTQCSLPSKSRYSIKIADANSENEDEDEDNKEKNEKERTEIAKIVDIAKIAEISEEKDHVHHL